MSGVAILISQLAAVFLVAMAIASLLSSALYQPIRRWLTGFNPQTRAAATLSYALLAPGVALIATALNSGTGSAEWWLFEHCHGSECGTHAPLMAAGSIGNIGLVTGASLLLLGFAVGLIKVLHFGRRQLQVLFNLGRAHQDYVVVDSDHLLAWCCGILRPKIVLSRGLLTQFDSQQINVILAHERAHAERLDNLRNISARWSSCLWPTTMRQQLRDDLASDNEACCDTMALREAPACFEKVVDAMSKQPQFAATHQHAHFGIGSAATRVAAATTANKQHPLLAHAIVFSVWISQALLVSASAHYVVELVGSLSI